MKMAQNCQGWSEISFADFAGKDLVSQVVNQVLVKNTANIEACKK
jgi:hypothetical protein